MNKGIAYIGILLVMIASVLANGVGSPDNECKENLGDSYYGVAKFEWENNAYALSEEGILFPYDISINGNNDAADWTSNENVQAIVKASTSTEEQGDYTKSGTVTAFGGHQISHVTFCGNEGSPHNGGGGNGGGNNVPEFSTITLGLAIVGAGLGLVLVRKQH